MRLAMVTEALPAKSNATGLRFPSSVTMSEPESPPLLNPPGLMISWSTKRAALIQESYGRKLQQSPELVENHLN